MIPISPDQCVKFTREAEGGYRCNRPGADMTGLYVRQEDALRAIAMFQKIADLTDQLEKGLIKPEKMDMARKNLAQFRAEAGYT
jgi:hypothetical protein